MNINSNRTNTFNFTIEQIEQSDNLTLHKNTFNNEDEHQIFFTKRQNHKLDDIIGASITITKIDAKYLESMDNFMLFVADERFTSLLEDFNKDIISFFEVANLYIEEDSVKQNFKQAINELINEIKDIENYPTLGNGIINLFSMTRVNLAKIVEIITRLSAYHKKTQLATKEAICFYNQCNITYDILKNLIYNSITDMNACLNGVNARFLMFYYYLEASFSGKSGLLVNKKNELLEILIQVIENDLINTSVIKYNSTISVHFHVAIKNILADKFGLQYIPDDSADNIIDIDHSLVKEITNFSELELLPVNITKALANDLLEEFKLLLSVCDCLHWLNQSLPADYFFDNNIFAELDSNFFSKYNSIYGIIKNDDRCLELESQNKLSFHELIETEYKNDKDFFSIKDIDIKLHAWVSSSYLPLNTHRIVTCSPT